jgi:hypothetical protein
MKVPVELVPVVRELLAKPQDQFRALGGVDQRGTGDPPR